LEKTEQGQLITIGRQLAETVRTVRAAGALPVVLGGGCLLTALGTVAGLQLAGERPGLAWFDAHGDLNTKATSPSGLLSGMPLAMLAGRGDLTLAQGIGIQQPIAEWHILLAGVRQPDPGEAAVLEESPMTVWSAEDLRVAGADELGRGLDSWPPIYLHVDLDVLDPLCMPAVDHPAPDGLAQETLAAGIESVAAGCPVSALGFAGFNPTEDTDDQGLETSLRVIEAAVRILVV
jgi:arginase